MGVEPAAIGRTADEQQRALYGESWSDRLSRLMRAYGLSQARLAAVIGLSAPMTSQLITGHRVKITNPTVFGRIVRLEQLQADPRVAAGDAASIAAVLDEVAASSPVLTAMTVMTGSSAPTGTAGPPEAGVAGGADGTASGAGEEVVAARHLASLAGPDALSSAAAAADEAGAPRLAALLRRALTVGPGGR